jgi:hypothetical protein
VRARFGLMPRCHVAGKGGGRGVWREEQREYSSTASVDLSPIFVEDENILLQC